MVDIAALHQLYVKLGTVCTDTRHLKQGSMFFALKGPNFNGNKFAQQALDAGASYCIVDEKEAKVSERCFLVKDVLTTLQTLATYRRKQMGIPVIAIAGSNGKTTTKELLGAVLDKRYKTFSTQGNLNNHIGLPVSLLSIQTGVEMAVVELGANHLVETANLCEIALPSHGLVTNNGKDHLEGYGSLDNVRKGNGELFEYLRHNRGIAFVSTLQKDLMEDSAPIKRYTYGDKEAYVAGRVESASPYLKVWFKEKGGEADYTIETKLTGVYNFENVMAAVAVGLFFGVEETDIVKAIEHYKPSNNRSQWKHHDGNDFIVDCYNANPSSMQLAIENLAALDSKNKKMVVLGDMFELGKYSEAEHRAMIALVASHKIDDVVLVGTEFKKANAAQRVTDRVFDNVRDLKQWFDGEKIKGYTILLKGSRGMTLEKLLEK